jgi:lysophospholipase L1-like esterase
MINFLKKKALLLVLLFTVQTVVFGQTDYQRAYLWEQEMAAFAAADKTSFPQSNGVVFVGSSSIRFWATLKEDFPEFYTINRGFGGSHLEDVNYYANQLVFQYKPRVIVLYAGENDIVAGKPVQNVFNDFKKFVALLQANLPKTRLIYISLKPSPSRVVFTQLFKELNALIKEETKRDRRLAFVDVYTLMTDANGEPLKNIFLSDQLHMNAEGYKIWQKAIFLPLKLRMKGAFR